MGAALSAALAAEALTWSDIPHLSFGTATHSAQRPLPYHWPFLPPTL